MKARNPVECAGYNLGWWRVKNSFSSTWSRGRGSCQRVVRIRRIKTALATFLPPSSSGGRWYLLFIESAGCSFPIQHVFSPFPLPRLIHFPSRPWELVSNNALDSSWSHSNYEYFPTESAWIMGPLTAWDCHPSFRWRSRLTRSRIRPSFPSFVPSDSHSNLLI